jgi:hypothetical protein
MLGIYGRLMTRWENRLATRDNNRIARPFDWGLEWVDLAERNGQSAAALDECVTRAQANSDEFFAHETPSDYRLDGTHLTFTSPLRSPYSENNTVHADLFRSPREDGRAVLVLPQWNADINGHVGLCKLLNRFGLTALRMSLAYHDRRMPPELSRADYHVSSNIGRTIHASRQSVMDCRACLDWLEQQGYQRLAILGTSLGSCIAFITAAHERRLRAGVFNHVSMNFSDVVWTGLSCRHISDSFAGRITQDELRHYWSVISPAAYLDKMSERSMKSLLIWARYDSTFLPVYSQQVLDAFGNLSLDHEIFTLPCGHYTTGQFPFNLIDGLVMCRYLAREL